MKIYVNEDGQIKAVNQSVDDTLIPYELEEDNPFEEWSESRICCYKVNVMPEKITEIIGTREETYTDLDGEEQTHTVDVTEERETGKYIVTMYTPALDSRLIEHFVRLGDKVTTNEETMAMQDELLADLLMFLE